MTEADIKSKESQALETADLVMLVIKYSRSKECRDQSYNCQWDKVAEKMGWTREKLNEFKSTHHHLFEYADEMVLENNDPVAPITDAEIVANQSVAAISMSPTDEQLAMAVAAADANLPKGLRSLGLNEKEIGIAEALQKFNKGFFKESMDIISSGVLVTAIKLQGQQREIEERLNFVREQIKEFGMFSTDERNNWVNEEKLLVAQYIEIGELLNDIQETWYRGAGYLALIRARMRGEEGLAKSGGKNGRTQRSGKPGFRPTVIVDPEGEVTGETP